MILGIGTDIIEIKRIEEAIQRRSTFMDKIFTQKEQIQVKEKNKKSETLAGMFAAKEAVSKALGIGFRGITPKQIEILTDDLGRPMVNLLEEAYVIGDKMGIKHLHVSISHCKTYAVAYVIAEGE